MAHSSQLGEFRESIFMNNSLSPYAPIRNIGNEDGYNPITARTFVPTEDGGGSNRYIKAKTNHVVFKDARNKLIRIKWANWRASSGLGSVIGGASEVVTGATAVGTARVGYYDADTGVYTEVNLVDEIGGTTTISAVPGANLTGIALVNFRAGSRIYPCIAADFPAGMVFCQKRADLLNGDAFQFGGSAIPLAGEPVQSFDTAWYGPCEIEVLDYPMISVGVASDSRETALADVPNNTYGTSGHWSRALGDRVPVVNVAVPGDTAADFAVPAQSVRRTAMLKRATKLALGFCVNDVIYNSRTSLQVRADYATIATRIGKGDPWVKTIDPATQGGTNTIQDAGRDPQRIAFNTWARSQPICLDIAISLENSGTPGIWNVSYIPPDGVHELNTANAFAVASSGFNYANAGLPLNPQTMILWTPNVLGASVLTTWLKPETASVSLWPDSSGNAANATQATPANQPVVASGGGLTFSAGKRMTSTLSGSRNTEGNFAVITVPSLAGSSKTMLGPTGNGGRQWRVETDGSQQVLRSGVGGKAAQSTYLVSANAKTLVIACIDPVMANTVLGVNGQNVSAGNDNTSFVGGTFTEYGSKEGGFEGFVGSIHEVVNLSTNPAVDIRQRVEGYLAWNNGIQGSLPVGHPWKNSAPTL